MSLITDVVGPRSAPKSAALPAQKIALYVSEDSSAMDVAAIASVFAHANRLDGQALYEICLVGPASSILLADGLRLSTIPSHELTAAVDTVVLTSTAPTARAELPLRRWLMGQLQGARRWCAVDQGVLGLAELGLASGYRVAARPGISASLTGLHVSLQIEEDILFRRDRHLWSCPGGAPVVDMCLAMIEDDCGRRLANAVARHLLVPGRRSGEHPQVSPVLVAQSRGGRDRELAQLVEWINQNVHVRLDIAAMASRVSMSERNFHRRFKEFTGFTPVEYITQVRLERARQLLMCDVSLKEVADHTGFASPTMVRRALRRANPADQQDAISAIRKA